MPSDDGLEDQIVMLVRRITRAIDSRSRSLLNDYGLTAPQLAVLQAIAGRNTVSAGSIAREVHLGQPTLTGILDRLEKRGFVQRIRDQYDRRGVNVGITDQGRQILAKTPPLLRDQFRERLRELHEWERTLVLSTLQRVAEMLDAPDESMVARRASQDSTPLAGVSRADQPAPAARVEVPAAVPGVTAGADRQTTTDAGEGS